MKALLTSNIHIMRWRRSVCTEIQWFQLRPGLNLIYFSDVHVLCTGLYLSKLNQVKNCKNKWGPFFFFSPKPNKIPQLPSKISEDLFLSFFFFSHNSKKWSQGGQEIVKKLGPFFFFSPKSIKIHQLPSKISEDFLVLIRENGPRGSRNCKKSEDPFYF